MGRSPWALGRAWWQNFLHPATPQPLPFELTRQRIYILPTRSGIIFALTLLAMLFGAMNYSNSLAFALAFLLFGVGLMAILHTFRNLYRLQLRGRAAAPIFAGEVARFLLTLENPTALDRYAITVEPEQGSRVTGIDIAAWSSGEVVVQQLCRQRGEQLIERLRISTLFPLGILRAWVPLQADLKLLVYPQPVAAGPLPPAEEGEGSRIQSSRARGHEEFNQIRSYVAGDSPRHLHWKGFAKGQPLMTRHYGGGSGSQKRILSWQQLAGLGGEERLSRLCDWCLQAERSGEHYGLQLPHLRIEPDQGAHHLSRCLTALALAPLPNSGEGDRHGRG